MITVRLGLPPKVEAAFWELPFPERMAVIAHEAGHKYHGHLWRRLLCGFVPGFRLNSADFSAMCHRQELEADAFARAAGYGPQLAAFLCRSPCGATFHHPATKPRIANLVR